MTNLTRRRFVQLAAAGLAFYEFPVFAQDIPRISERQLKILKRFLNAKLRLAKNPYDHDAASIAHKEGDVAKLLDIISSTVIHKHTGWTLKIDDHSKLLGFTSGQYFYSFHDAETGGVLHGRDNRKDQDYFSAETELEAQGKLYITNLLGLKRRHPWTIGESAWPLKHYRNAFIGFINASQQEKNGAKITLENIAARIIGRKKDHPFEKSEPNLANEKPFLFAPRIRVWDGCMPDKPPSLGTFLEAELYKDLDTLIGNYQRKFTKLPHNTDEGYDMKRAAVELVHQELKGYVVKLFGENTSVLSTTWPDNRHLWLPKHSARLAELYPDKRAPGHRPMPKYIRKTARLWYDKKDSLKIYLKLIGLLANADVIKQVQKDLVRGDSLKQVVSSLEYKYVKK